MTNNGIQINKTIRDLPPSGIRKFFDVASTMKDVVSLGVGEPDFDTPWHVSEAGIYSLEMGHTHYTSNSGILDLRKEICRYLKRKYNLQYDVDQTLVSVGASEDIDLVMRSIVTPGDEVLVVEPCFVSYKPAVIMSGGVPVCITTKEENEFRLTPEEIEEKITPKTKAIIFGYPNNPTGAIMERGDLERIAEVLRNKDILVISDEIYSELTYGAEHVSIAGIEGMYEKTIVINGFSKSFAMTGWRLGYAVGPKEIIEAMTKIHQYIIMCAPTIAQYAGLEALRNGDGSVLEMKKAYDMRRRYLLQEFRRIGLTCFEPMGAFYIFPCIKPTGMSSEEFCEKLLFEGGVAAVPGNAFGESGEGYIRCSYAASMESLKAAVERIERFINR